MGEPVAAHLTGGSTHADGVADEFLVNATGQRGPVRPGHACGASSRHQLDQLRLQRTHRP